MKKVLFSLLCSAAICAAAPVGVTYVNPGTPAIVDTDRNDYVGAYTLQVGGQNVQAMCMDDFYLTSGSWNANVTSAAATDLSNTYLGNKTYTVNGYQFTSSQVYAGEAYLFSQIEAPGADRIHLQDAAWTIMDDITGHTPHSNGDQAVNNIISDVLANAGTFNASSYEILSQVSPGSSPEQEFIVGTPEPATWSLLAMALSFLGLAVVRSGKQKARALSTSSK